MTNESPWFMLLKQTQLLGRCSTFLNLGVPWAYLILCTRLLSGFEMAKWRHAVQIPTTPISKEKEQEIPSPSTPQNALKTAARAATNIHHPVNTRGEVAASSQESGEHIRTLSLPEKTGGYWVIKKPKVKQHILLKTSPSLVPLRDEKIRVERIERDLSGGALPNLGAQLTKGIPKLDKSSSWPRSSSGQDQNPSLGFKG